MGEHVLVANWPPKLRCVGSIPTSPAKSKRREIK